MAEDVLDLFGSPSPAPLPGAVAPDLNKAPDILDMFGDAAKPDPSLSIRSAVDTTPDEAAKVNELSTATGMPPEAVAVDPAAVEKEVKARAITDTVANSPVTASFFTDPDNAKVAQDSAKELTDIERYAASVGPTLEQQNSLSWAQAGENLASQGRGLMKGVEALGAGVLDFVRGQINQTRAQDDLTGTIGDAVRDVVPGGIPGLVLSEAAREKQRVAYESSNTALEATANELFNKGTEDFSEGGLAALSGIRSMGSTAPGVVLSLLTGNVGPGLATAYSTTAGLSYAQAREQGLSPVEAQLYSMAQGGIEVGGELLPLTDLINKTKIGTPFFDLLKSQFVTENVTEQLTTVFQDAVEDLTLHPDKTLGDYLAERPDAALQTFLATSAATITQTAIVRAATLPFQRDTAAAAVALDNRTALDGMRQSVLASPLTERDRPRAADHVAQALKAGSVDRVYISSQGLAALAAASPDPQAVYAQLGVEDKIQEALLLGGDVQMSAEQFANKVMTTPAYEALADHIRLGADQMTTAEAVAFNQTGLQDEIQRLGLEANLAGVDTGAAAVPADPLTQAADLATTLGENELGLQGLFRSAADAGMTPKQYESYLVAVAQAADVGRKRQEAKLVKQQLREADTTWKTEREKVREQVREQVENTPVYSAANAIGRERIDRAALLSLMPDRMVYDQATGANTIETSEQQLKAMGLPKIDGREIYTPKGQGGVHPDILAQQHGFNDGLEMLLSIMDAPAKDVTIERVTDDVMNKQFGDLRNTREGLNEALESLHNDTQAEVLAFELNQLRQARKEGRLSAKQVREVARERLLNYDIKDITVEKFIAAERREARLAAKLLRQGDRTGATQAKFRQLLNFQMAQETYKVKAEIKKEGRYLQKWARTNKKHPSIAGKFVDAIQQILVDYKVGPKISDAKRLDMEKWMYALGVEAGADVPIHPRLLEEDARKNYQDLTLREWNDLVQGIHTLESYGRAVKKYVVNGKTREIEEVKAEALAESAALPEMKHIQKERERQNASAFQKVGRFVRGLSAAFTKVEFALQQLDNGKLGGVWHKMIFQKAVDMQSAKYDMLKKYSEPLVKDLSELSGFLNNRFSKTVSLGNRVGTRADLLALALNVGNQSNLDTVIEGSAQDNGAQPQTEESIRTALEQLTAAERAWVQKVWDRFEELRPMVEEVYQNEHGIKPSRILPKEYKFADGTTLRGGYYPLMYDPTRRKTKSAEVEDLIHGRESKATVYTGMTKERTPYVAPVLFDVGALPKAMEKTIHYITHFEGVKDLRRMLNDKEISTEINNKLGEAQYAEMQNWLEGLAAPAGKRADGVLQLNAVANWMRGNVVSAVLGGSLTTLASQTLGWASSIDVLGRKEGGSFSALRGQRWLASGLYASLDSRTVASAFEKSKELRTRAASVDRDIDGLNRKLQGKTSTWADIKHHGLSAIGYFQLYTVDISTWLGGYNQAIAGGKTEAEAVNYADAVIRTSQGSGHMKDRSQVQRSTNGFAQMFTMFSTYTMVAYNLERQTLQDINPRYGKVRAIKNLPGAVSRLAMLIVVPALADALLRGNGPDDEDEDGGASWAGLTILKYAGGSLPMIGGLVKSAAEGFDPAKSLTPVSSLISGVDAGAKAGWKAFMSDEEVDSDDVRNMLRALGLLAGAPGTTQIDRILRAMDEEDATIRDYVAGPKRD